MPENLLPPMLPNQPPVYVTSLAVRSAKSYAWSTKCNPRGLESPWYGVYALVFTNLATYHDGSIIFHPQFTLSIPGLQAQWKKLRERFEIAGLSWSDSESDVDDDENLDRDILKSLEATHIEPRKSTRIAEQDVKKTKAEKDKQKALETDLRNRKAKLLEALESNDFSYDSDQDEETLVADDISINTTASVSDKDAVDECPDIVLNHVAFIKLPNPESQQDMVHNVHRGGLKIYHKCTALVGEIKSPSARVAGPDIISGRILIAQKDLIEYCSAYFLRETKSESVTAFAAAGPFWRWAVIKKEEVPDFDWLTKTPVIDREETTTFISRFGEADEYFEIGTPESDAELTKINRDHIHPIVQNHAHTGPEPKWNAKKKRWNRLK